MLTLALETSYRTTGVALADQGRILSRQAWPRQQSSSEVITSLLEKCLQEAGTSLEQLKFIAVTTGPGSFTGIRVGINVARSLGYALDCPLVAVTTPWLLAQDVPPSGQRLGVLLEAFQNLFYYASFSWQEGQWQAHDNIRAVRGEQLALLLRAHPLVVGPGLANLPMEVCQQLHESTTTRTLDQIREPRPERLAELVSQDAKKFSILSWRDLKPLYIRDSEAEEKLRSGILKPTRIFAP